MENANIVTLIPDPIVSKKRNVLALVRAEESSEACSSIRGFRHYTEGSVRFIGRCGNQNWTSRTDYGASWNANV